eukprot:9195085-Pyramimonas_sp.AAC.1
MTAARWAKHIIRVRALWIKMIGACRKEYDLDGAGLRLPDYTSPWTSATTKNALEAGWSEARRHRKDKRTMEDYDDERRPARRLSQSMQQFWGFYQ